MDNKHTIFGKLVGGMNTFDSIEAVPTGKEDLPKSDIEIIDSQVFVNPFRDVIQELLKKEHKKQVKEEKKAKVDVNERWFVQKKAVDAESSEEGEVGKYLSGAMAKGAATAVTVTATATTAAKDRAKGASMNAATKAAIVAKKKL